MTRRARPAPAPVPAPEPRSVAAAVAAATLIVLGFLPWYNWLPTGHDPIGYRWIGVQALLAAMALASAVLLAWLSEKVPLLWRPGLATRASQRAAVHPRVVALVIALAACVAYLLVAVLIFGKHPADVDDAVQLLQARAYARGRLWQELGPYPEFLASTHDVVRGTRAFAQFPPGNPALLALGVLAGVPWAVVPLLGAGCAYLFARLLELIEPRATVRLGAAILFPFTMVMIGLGGSHMNHVPTLFMLLVAMYGLAHATTEESTRRGAWAFVAGLGFGAAATIRPVDAASFALPAAAWLAHRAWRDRRMLPALLLSGAGVLVAMAPMLVVNARTTGNPLVLGYTALWGKAHGLGFHESPYGPRHTPIRGIAIVSYYFNIFQQQLFPSPIPALAFPVGGLLLSRRLRAFDRYLLAAAALLVVGYWAYWYRALLLAPRFLLALTPILVLWTARFPALVRERAASDDWHRLVVFAGVSSIVGGVVSLAPARFHDLKRQFTVVRADVSAMEREQGVSNAIVLVREHWGNALVARLWALGVPHPDAARAFDNTDLCRLDALVSELENRRADSSTATGALRALLADSLETHRSVLPGSQVYVAMSDPAAFTQRCAARLAELDRGVLSLTPERVFEGKNIYVRDLHARDTLLGRAYPGRSFWVLEPAAKVGVRLVPLKVDSAHRDWYARDR